MAVCSPSEMPVSGRPEAIVQVPAQAAALLLPGREHGQGGPAQIGARRTQLTASASGAASSSSVASSRGRSDGASAQPTSRRPTDLVLVAQQDLPPVAGIPAAGERRHRRWPPAPTRPVRRRRWPPRPGASPGRGWRPAPAAGRRPHPPTLTWTMTWRTSESVSSREPYTSRSTSPRMRWRAGLDQEGDGSGGGDEEPGRAAATDQPAQAGDQAGVDEHDPGREQHPFQEAVRYPLEPAWGAAGRPR